jgi:hypothetical protein
VIATDRAFYQQRREFWREFWKSKMSEDNPPGVTVDKDDGLQQDTVVAGAAAITDLILGVVN